MRTCPQYNGKHHISIMKTVTLILSYHIPQKITLTRIVFYKNKATDVSPFLGSKGSKYQYACETSTVYQHHAKKLNHFHLSCLRKILKIRWQDKITEVLKKAKMQSVHTLLKLAQLRWTGHVTRMPDQRLPKKVLYGELQEGKCSQGGQKKCHKDTLKASLKDFNIPTESWEQAKWRFLINKGASQFEAKKICEAERKRKERKARAKGPSSDSARSEFTFSICNRQFRAKIGLYSHQPTHKHT